MLLTRIMEQPDEWPARRAKRLRRAVSWAVMGFRPEWRTAFLRRTESDERRVPHVRSKKRSSTRSTTEAKLWKLPLALTSRP